MPVHLTNYLIMLPLLAWIVWRRVSRQFGRQPIQRKRMIARIAVFAIVGALLSLAGDLRVNQVVDYPNLGARVAIRKDLFARWQW